MYVCFGLKSYPVTHLTVLHNCADFYCNSLLFLKMAQKQNRSSISATQPLKFTSLQPIYLHSYTIWIVLSATVQHCDNSCKISDSQVTSIHCIFFGFSLLRLANYFTMWPSIKLIYL